MKRTLVLLGVLAAVVATVHADPALGGGRGLWRVQDARVEEDGALVLANRWMFDRLAGGDSSVYHGPLFGLEMTYAPFPFVEVFGSLVGVNDFRTSPNRLKYAWQGQTVGAKLSLNFIPVLKLAASGHWWMARDEYTFIEEGYLDGLFDEGKSWRAIGALRFWELYKTLPTLMFNYGQSFEDGGNQFAGAGIEFSSDAIDVFIEATSETPKGEAFGAFIGEDFTPKARVAPGVRVRIPYFHITGGVEIGLTDEVPDYEILAGFTFVSPFPKPKPKPWGRLAGKVVDERSGMPLKAKVTSPNGKFRAQETDDETGIFFLQKAPTGVIVVQAEAEGYLPEAVPLVITDQGYANHTFKLKPMVPYGTVTGRVFDTYSGAPLSAEVGFAGTDIKPATSNELTGFFRVDNVPAGLVSVRIEKDGYFPEERVAEVEDGGVSKLNVGMAPLDMKGTFKGRVTDKKTGEPVEATISFIGGNRPNLMADAETGAFETELPVGPYDVKVDAWGYVSQTSTFSIEKGGTTERNYELVSKGMILTLRGVYFEFGKAELRTESYPALTEAAQIMKDNPDIMVEIQGHTDAIGGDEANQKLSERRAYSVVNFMVQYGGIDPKRLAARGYGESKPIAPNDTDEGRQLNRRVEFVIQK